MFTFDLSRWLLLRIRNVSGKICRETTNTHFIFYNFFESCLLWDKEEKLGRGRQAADDKYGACALHAGYPRLQTHTQIM